VSLREELRDPWGAVVAGTAGGVVWALPGTNLLLALGVGAAVYGAKTVAGLITNRRPERAALPSAGPPPPPGSPAAGWVTRADAAVRELDRLVAGADAETGARLGDVVEGATGARTAVGRLASRVTAVEAALGRMDPRRLEAERSRLEAQLSSLPEGSARAEHARAVKALGEQVAVGRRLAGVREALLARAQSTTLGLEGLVARVAEVLVMSEEVGAVEPSDWRVRQLSDDLEALRTGLAEAEALTRGPLDPDSG
jgi:hypothetical protein